jgi:hypothetical protein
VNSNSIIPYPSGQDRDSVDQSHQRHAVAEHGWPGWARAASPPQGAGALIEVKQPAKRRNVRLRLIHVSTQPRPAVHPAHITNDLPGKGKTK